MSNEKINLTFKVQSFRRIPNPYIKAENGEKAAEKTEKMFYFLIAWSGNSALQNMLKDLTPEKSMLYHYLWAQMIWEMPLMRKVML